MKILDAFEHPEVYPGLVERKLARVLLRIWCYPSFDPCRSWAAIQAREGLFLRRIVLDQRRIGGVKPNTYGSEVPLEHSVFDGLVAGLRAIELPPFLPVSTFGIDGTSYGVETGGYLCSARLAWWETPPVAWEALRNWHAQAVALFEPLLPAATPEFD